MGGFRLPACKNNHFFGSDTKALCMYVVDSRLIVMKEGEKGTERGTKGVRSHGIILCHVQNPHGHFLKVLYHTNPNPDVTFLLLMTI